MLKSLVLRAAKPFIGTGIGEKIPVLKKLFDLFYSNADKGERTVDIFGSKFTYSAQDSGLGAFLTLKGEYEPLQTKLFLDDIQSRSVFVDVGANIGYYSVLAASKGAKVYAFEPDRSNLKLLNLNVEQNSFNSLVNVYDIALGEKDGEVNFSEDSMQKGNSGIDNDGDLKVKMLTLDSFIAKYNLLPTIVKVDIEGYEPKFLEGAEGFLSKNKPVLYIECNLKSLAQFDSNPDLLVDMLKGFGYEIEIIDEVSKQVYPYSNENLKKALSKVPYTNFRCK